MKEDSHVCLNPDADFGSAQEEALDDEMEPLPGFAGADCDLTRGDSMAQEMRWRGARDTRSLRKRPIRLKICISDCWLYSFRSAYAAEG